MFHALTRLQTITWLAAVGLLIVGLWTSDRAGFPNIIASVIWPLTILSCVVLLSQYIPQGLNLLRHRFVHQQAGGDGTGAWISGSSSLTSEVVALLAAATVAMRYEQDKGTIDFAQSQKLVKNMTSLIRSGKLEALRDKKILWAHRDTRHDLLERDVFQLFGAKVQFVLSTSRALEAMHAEKFDAVISNMRRDEESEAGFTLFSQIDSTIEMPACFIYTRTVSDELRKRAADYGIRAIVNMPEDLFNAVTNAIHG